VNICRDCKHCICDQVDGYYGARCRANEETPAIISTDLVSGEVTEHKAHYRLCSTVRIAANDPICPQFEPCPPRPVAPEAPPKRSIWERLKGWPR
jgi:hypothetical protein